MILSVYVLTSTVSQPYKQPVTKQRVFATSMFVGLNAVHLTADKCVARWHDQNLSTRIFYSVSREDTACTAICGHGRNCFDRSKKKRA